MFMRRRAFFLAPLMFLLLLGGLLMMFSRGRSADAYEAGFVAGQMAASQAESPAPAPIAPSNVYGGPHTATGFSFFGGSACQSSFFCHFPDVRLRWRYW
ncbi:MAG: hypothetical protein H6651_13775 [Ardenticatenales bacterium]|nr:hypothetical protein [Ardenticatenales bacterium]